MSSKKCTNTRWALPLVLLLQKNAVLVASLENCRNEKSNIFKIYYMKSVYRCVGFYWCLMRMYFLSFLSIFTKDGSRVPGDLAILHYIAVLISNVPDQPLWPWLKQFCICNFHTKLFMKFIIIAKLRWWFATFGWMFAR